jgi:putative component of toxin-antitoxin plasmid stabilization module
MERIVVVIGATVIPVKKGIAELRVSISAGRRLSGALNVYQ